VSAISPVDIAGIAVGPRAMRVYLRHCRISLEGDADPLWVSPAHATRWWTSRGTLYVAEELDTVMAEHCRYSAANIEEADPTGGVGLTVGNFRALAAQPLGDPVRRRALFSVVVEFDRFADLRSPASLATLATLGITNNDLIVDNFGPCPAIAQAGEALGWQALRAQSAAYLSGNTVAIFRDSFPPRSRWSLVDNSARPSIRIAYQTRYRAAERPSWLGL
jgi:hypothetical protein